MKYTRTITAFAAAAMFVLAGCSDSSDDLGPNADPEPTTETEPEADESAEDQATEPADEESEEAAEQAAEEVEVDEDDAEDWQYIEEFDEPVVWEDSGVRLAITGIGINDATHPDLPTDVSSMLDDGVQTVVVLEMTASNDTGTTINFYPNQGTIQLGREQVDADLWFSDDFAGMDWRDGVDDDGQVFWMLENTSFDDAVAAGELTFVASAPHDSESWDNVAGEAEITVSWG